MLSEMIDQSLPLFFSDLIIRNVPEALALAEKLPSDVFRIGDRRSLDTGNPPNYDFHRVFLNNAYKLSWKFESVESIRVRIECASDGWCGLGFGQDMTVAGKTFVAWLSHWLSVLIFISWRIRHYPFGCQW